MGLPKLVKLKAKIWVILAQPLAFRVAKAQKAHPL
jgi:hypothetical protein